MPKFHNKMKCHKKRKKAASMRAALLFVFLTCAIFFCGCSEVKEINDMAVISGFSVDITNENVSDNMGMSGSYLVTAEVVNKNEEGSPKENRQIISARGTTFAEAISNCNFLDSRQMYASHARAIVMSRDLAEQNGILPVLDYVMHNYKTRLATDLFISDLPTAKAVSELSSPSSGLIYYDLEEMVKNDSFYGVSIPTKVYQAVDVLAQENLALTIPLISQQDEKPILAGLAVFRDGKMVGTLSARETMYLQILQNHISRAHLSLPETGDGVEIIKARTGISKKTEEAKSVLVVSIKLTCSLSQTENLRREKDLSRLASDTARFVETECKNLISKVQSWNCDLFGFSETFQSRNSLSENSRTVSIKDIPVRVDCTVVLKEGEIHR